MPINYVLLETIEVTQAAASVLFDNIPQTGYTDLKVVMSSRKSTSALDVSKVQLNTTDAVNNKYIDNGGGASPRSGGVATYQGFSQPSDYSANTFSNCEFYIPNAFASGVKKTLNGDNAAENLSTSAFNGFTASTYTTVTGAVTSIGLFPNSGNWVVGSTFSLYGIAAFGTTPVVAPKAAGGNIVANDGTYWYHAFTSSGTFTPQLPVNCDVLVVAGGGSGGENNGGGGAGGLLYFASQSLSLTNYTVTVGAGGAGQPAGSGNGGVTGSDSQFGALTLVKGGGGGGSAGSVQVDGQNGGSGGGAKSGGTVVGTATSGQGNNGGAGTYNSGNYPGGGGGGAGAVGGGAPNANTAGSGGVGAGGTGYANYISLNTMAIATNTGVLSGGNYYYAGGGGAGTYGGGTTGTGGLGGGGAATANGIAATGGGGGGGTRVPNVGSGSGGSGVVIIRYAMA
jgi:hypothetical protein